MQDKVYVKMRHCGPINYFKTGLELKGGEIVIVEAERGTDFGRVILNCEKHLADKLTVSGKRILRVATEFDLDQIKKNRTLISNVFSTCQQKIDEHKLLMKLVEAEYSFDRSKLIFYFTSEGRVDFRELVKDLAKIFKTRIELRQIGPRDETRIFGGYGCCGRELCCRRFLREFETITIKMAKDQHLPLNPPKISGVCGRLMCCLFFEHSTYRDLSKNLPKEGERINTPEGKAKVLSVNTITGKLLVENEKGAVCEIDFKKIPCKEKDA